MLKTHDLRLPTRTLEMKKRLQTHITFNKIATADTPGVTNANRMNYKVALRMTTIQRRIKKEPATNRLTHYRCVA